MFRNLLFAAAMAAMPVTALAGDLTPKAAGEVVDQLVENMDGYMDPKVGAAVQADLKRHRAEYVKLDSRAAFAEAVTRDLYAVSHDKHLKVSLETLDASRGARLTDEQQALVDRRLAYGLMAIRRLPGNVGLLKMSYFEQGEAGAKLVETALDLLQDTDALIIDLRENHGGGGASDETFLGHLSRAPIPMAKIYWRTEGGGTEVMQRAPRAPKGQPLYADKPVFVLTSRETGSAAEAFAYDLQAAKRATLIGETTAGAANPANRGFHLDYGFRVFIPTGKVVHPTTGGNWEGVGVQPDIAVARDQALTEAYGRALGAAKPAVSTPKSEAERMRAISDPRAALLADQAL
ncbi:S41 family peptidase [Phenylobacterium sp.]|uniref:S41 family peptidase n=1 Tax=Phenylobacterium sp. TaxID=1871053 RepID=UPI0025F4ED83|nr:S41 family peptidase [Phenylobacterium sp.]